jgi:hypothetical protein
MTLQSGGHNDSLIKINRLSILPDNRPQSSIIPLKIQKENKITNTGNDFSIRPEDLENNSSKLIFSPP